jgi:hypothetical protein
VPRLTIRQAQLKLKFAISEINDQVTGLSEDELRELWSTALNSKVVPKALSEIGRSDNKRVVSAFERVVGPATPTADFDPRAVLVEGREDELIESTLSFLTRQVGAIAPSTRRSFERLDVKGALERAVRAEIPELVNAARQLEQARRAAQADLNVAVTTASLTSLPDSQISELVVEVSMDELQRGSPAELPQVEH